MIKFFLYLGIGFSLLVVEGLSHRGIDFVIEVKIENYNRV
jgi:hypothetical protein